MSLPFPNLRKPALAASALALAVSAACVQPEETKVSVKPLEANIVFGVTPPPAPLPPFAPGADVTADATPVAAQGAAGDVDISELEEGFTFKPRPKLGAASNPCPDAALNAFPERQAGQKADTFPKVGTYRWKRGGKYTVSAFADHPIPYSGFEKRVVQNVKVIRDEPDTPDTQGVQTGGGGKEYTFETVQPSGLGTGKITSFWRVKTNAASATPRSLTVTGPNNGDPERGLALEGIKVEDENGSTVSDYRFPTGVLYMPMPAIAGTRWQAAAVDPKTGETLSIEATLGERDRVDACGDIVEGWRVKSTLTYAGEQSISITYDYIVATSLGAILVYEGQDFQSADNGGTHYQLSYTFGQLKPDPLPAANG